MSAARQGIEVPTISSPSRHCWRRVRFAEQTAEQLVEVPTPVSYPSLLQRIMEQHVDIPVPGHGGRLAGLQGFLPRQSSTAPTVAQIVDNPASGGGLQGFRPGQRSSASFSSRAGVHEYADEPGEGAIWDGVIGLWGTVAPFLSPWCGKKDVPTVGEPEPVRWSRITYSLAQR